MSRKTFTEGQVIEFAMEPTPYPESPNTVWTCGIYVLPSSVGRGWHDIRTADGARYTIPTRRLRTIPEVLRG